MAEVDNLRAENKRLHARIEQLTQDLDEARRVSREWERERHSFKAQAGENMDRVREADEAIKATLKETGALSLTALCTEFKGLMEHNRQLRIALQEASPHVSRQRIWGHTEIDRADAKEWWEQYGNQKFVGCKSCGSDHGRS